MQKLITAWKANPTIQNAEKIAVYNRKHPMAIILLTSSDQTLIASAIYQATYERP
jgi:hypothetical protein